MHIEEKVYGEYEISILGGMIGEAEALRLFHLNPAFEAWFMERRKLAAIAKLSYGEVV